MNVTSNNNELNGGINTSVPMTNVYLSGVQTTSQNPTVKGNNFSGTIENVSENNTEINGNSAVYAVNTEINKTSPEIVLNNDAVQDASGTLTCLAVGPDISYQQYPSIYDDNIVWIDSSKSEQAVHLYNITTGREKIINNNSPSTPVIYKNLIVYSISDNYYGTSDLNIFNVSTNQEFTFTPSDGYDRTNPVMNNDRIVYMDDSKGVENIVLYNITTGATDFLTDDSSGPDHLLPAIYGDWVVWYTGSDSNAVLTLYNIDSGLINTINSTCRGINSPPGIYEDRVVWQDSRNNEFDIYLYNITTQQETLITPDTADSDQKDPAIFGNFIVWDDNRDQTYGNENIFMFDLETNITSTITGDEPPSARIEPQIFGNRILWAENENHTGYHIYMFTLGPEQIPLISDFSVNITQGKVPLTVQFSDKSSGNPSSYLWEFGDGNESSEQNPVYTYLMPGQYSPFLIVSNPYARNYSVRENMILAGAVPFTQFSADPSSGLAPLNVSFTDLTQGYPTSWHWDFGDNSTADEQNPSHIYPCPGNYSVTLTTQNAFGNNSAGGNVYVIGNTVNQSAFYVPGLVHYVLDTGFFTIDTTNISAYSFVLGENNTELDILPKISGLCHRLFLLQMNIHFPKRIQ